MKRKCFIIMPFSGTKTVIKKENWDKIYEDFFVPAWGEIDFKCDRTDVKRGSITKDIIEKCFSADIVMADLTDAIPNVMYELGLRHTFNKPSMMVKQEECKIPFDVQDYKVHNYENTPTGLKHFKKLVKDVIKDLDNHPDKPDNPVWDMIQLGSIELIDQSTSIEVTIKRSLVKYPRMIKNAITIEGVNKGRRPVTINGYGLILPVVDEVMFFTDPLHSEPRLPALIRDGEIVSIIIDQEDVIEGLIREGYNDIIEVRGFLSTPSMKGRIISKPLKVDINRWLKQINE